MAKKKKEPKGSKVDNMCQDCKFFSLDAPDALKGYCRKIEKHVNKTDSMDCMVKKVHRLLKTITDHKTGDKYVFLILEENRKVIGHLFEYGKSEADVITRVIKCDAQDTWDPIIGIALVKLRLETSVNNRFDMPRGWKHIKEWAQGTMRIKITKKKVGPKNLAKCEDEDGFNSEVNSALIPFWKKSELYEPLKAGDSVEIEGPELHTTVKINWNKSDGVTFIPIQGDPFCKWPGNMKDIKIIRKL